MRSIITVTCRVIDTKIATTVNKTDHGKATPKQNTQHSSLNEKKIQVDQSLKRHVINANGNQHNHTHYFKRSRTSEQHVCLW